MSLSAKSNKVCRACLSTEGDLISLFPNNVDSSRITEKIMSVCRLPVRKEDGLPDKICKKCIYLVDSFDCFKKQLLSADRRLRKLWENKQDKLPEKSIIKKEFVPSKTMERDELDYNIEWISDKERILVEATFKRKWAEEDKNLENCKLQATTNVTQIIPAIGIENKTIKTEAPDNLFEDIDTFDPEEQEEKMEKEAIDNAVEKPDKYVKSIKKESIKKEKTEVPMEVDTTESEDADESRKTEFMRTENPPEDKKKIVDTKGKKKKTDDSGIKIDPNVIVISDTEEVDYSENRRNALCSLTTNCSGLIDNENTSWKTQGGMKTPNGARIAVHSDQVLGIDKKKGSSIMKTESARKIRSRAVSRKYFQCTTCRVNLYTVAAVLLHHNQIHTSPKDSLSCRMCDTKFPSKTDLFAHFNLHTESHLYRCSYCPNEFVLKNNLMRHMNDHKNRSCILPPNGAIQNGNVNIVPAIPVQIREDLEARGIIVANNLPVPITDNNQNTTMDHEEACGKENVVPTDNSTAMIVENTEEILMEQDQEHDNN